MKMRQITVEVDIHGTADYVDDHGLTGQQIAEAIQTFLTVFGGIGHMTVTVKKDEDYLV